MNFLAGPSRISFGPKRRRDPELMPATSGRLSNVFTIEPIRLQPRQRRATAPMVYGRGRASIYGGNHSCERLPQVTVQPPRTHSSKLICPICLNDIFPKARLSMKAVKCCGYVFCTECLNKCTQFNSCPMCKQHLSPRSALPLRFHQE